jgi:hypothetical protein
VHVQVAKPPPLAREAREGAQEVGGAAAPGPGHGKGVQLCRALKLGHGDLRSKFSNAMDYARSITVLDTSAISWDIRKSN